MFKANEFYITTKGRLVKILSQFKYADGFEYVASMFVPGNGWHALRYRVDGTCSLDNPNNQMAPTSTFDTYLTFLNFTMRYDRATNTWVGNCHDGHNAPIVQLTGLEDQERALKLMQLGAQEKLLTWMREAGYVDEIDEGAT